MNELIRNLERAIATIEEMKEMLTSGDEDAPVAFLEAAHDVQEQMNRAVHMAISPYLSKRAVGQVIHPPE